MIIDGQLQINGVLLMYGGANKWFDFHHKTEAEVTALIGAWGAAEEGKCWYNDTTDQFEMWNGATRVLLG